MELERVVRTNCVGAFATIQAFYPLLKVQVLRARRCSAPVDLLTTVIPCPSRAALTQIPRSPRARAISTVHVRCKHHRLDFEQNVKDLRRRSSRNGDST